jgi:glycosyltransferase involved in cell wall biosynthesis
MQLFLLGDAMKLSVIIPTYNRAEVLPRAIDSVLLQEGIDRSQLEIIVVDDGSDDDTETVISQRYAETVYIKQSNHGVSAARNTGLHAAKGEWIALLDSDDEWLPGKLKAQFHALEQSKLLVCHTEEIWIRNGVRVNQMKKHQKQGGEIFEHCLPLCAMSPSSIIIHSCVFEDIGEFDETLPACEDYDLWLRLAAKYSVSFVDEACIRKFGGHEDQLSRQYWGMDRFRVIALQKILDSNQSTPILSSDMRLSALNMLLEKLRILQIGARKHQNSELIRYCDQALARWSV